MSVPAARPRRGVPPLALLGLAAIAACASSDAEIARTAADPSVIAPMAPTSGVLRPDFDPQSLGPAGPAASGSGAHDGHEHHHGHGAPKP